MNSNKLDWDLYRDGTVAYPPETISNAKEKPFSNIKKMNSDTDKVSVNMALLETCSRYYDSLEDFRDRRMRNRKYVRGDQWYELMTHPETGETMTEEDYISSRGKIPFKQNILTGIVKNHIGRYRMNPTQSIAIARARDKAREADIMSNALSAVHELNSVIEIDVQNLREFLISGMAIWKTRYVYWKNRDIEDVFIEAVNPNYIFFNTDIQDIRTFDLRLVGQIIDADLDDIIGSFAETEQDAEYIRECYSPELMADLIDVDALTPTKHDNISFMYPNEANKCRMYEVWQLKSAWRTYVHDTSDGSMYTTDRTMEEIGVINAQRIQEGQAYGVPLEQIPLIRAKRVYDRFWAVKYLTPYGKCLFEGETMYDHKDHPFTLLLYPFIDSEVYGVVEDLIDQQRFINHIVTLLDFILGASAKGTLLVAEEAIPKDMNIEDFAEEWSKVGGVIKYKAKNGIPVPTQVSSNAANPAAQELLMLQIKLLEDISGVSSALQGQAPKSNTPASLYAQQAQNSAVNSKDAMDSFIHAKRQRDYKVLQLIQQYYDDNRHVRMFGRDMVDGATDYYDKNAIKDIKFDVAVRDSLDTPVYRSILDETLFRLLEAQLIDLKMFLHNSSMPFAEKLLQEIELREKAMQQGEVQPGQMTPELMAALQDAGQQAGKGASPQSKNIINKLSESLSSYGM